MVSDPAESATSRLRGWLHAMLVHRHGSEVYQTSTMGALLDGVYDGDALSTGSTARCWCWTAAATNCAATGAHKSPMLSSAPRSPSSPGSTPTARSR